MDRASVETGERLAELERQRERLESLLEISPVAIVTTDADTAVTSWNPAAEQLFGYRREEAIGRKIDELIANRDDLRLEALAFKEDAARSGRFKGVTRRTRNDGSLVDVEVLAVPMTVDGEAAGYYAIYQDVSELHRQKQYYESLLETSPAAVMTVDPHGIVTSWNPAAERLLGYSRDEAIGRNIDDLVAKNPELRQEADEVSRRAARGEQMHTVTRRTRKDGSLVDVDVVASGIFVGGEPVGFYAIYNDVSELQRQRRYYEALVQASPTAVVTVDLQARVTSWNPAAEELFGYTAGDAVGSNIDDLVAKDERIRAEAIEGSRLLASGERRDLVTQRTRKDGSLVDVEVRGAPILIGGEQVGSYALYHDISELQRQKRYYQSLLELSPTAVVTFDLDAKVTSWNGAAERLFGYAADEALGRDIDDLVAGDERIRAEAAAITRLGQVGERAQLVTQRTRKDGSLVDVQLLAAPIVVGGEHVGYHALYHDISELQQQRRYYEALVQSSPNAVALLDREGTVTSWNPAAERLFGYSATEALGRDIDDLVATDPSLRTEAAAFTERGISGKRTHAITKRSRKDGSFVDVEMFGAPVSVGDEAVGLYALYHDIGDLQRAREEAEAATEAKSAFLATMSHEIRTPMNAVIGMTDLLLRTDLDAEQRSFAEVIRSSGEALLSVINDILDFSKIEAGRVELDLHTFDLRESVESALELVARAAAEKNLDLAYLLHPGTPEAVVGDAARLRQILLNLLNNAVKFTDSGEVVVSVGAERLATGGGPAEDGSAGRYRLHIAVRDTGIGIPPERIGNLFESFSQVDASTTRRYGGTGLGLAISRRLSELMGGRMWVESQPGEGSTFHFTIEADAAPRPGRVYDETDTAPLASRRMLVLDDNATNRHIVRSHAESWGMLVRETGRPAEALDWIRRGDPMDVAILDMQMPEMDGVAVAREIRRSRADALPLILLTSLGRREEEEGTLFDARLTKPIRPSQLYDVLLGVLGAADRLPIPGVATAAAPAAPVPGQLRILVVEDNAVNRQLALLLLEKIGYRAEVAVNGVEAVEIVERDSYDVVLMDIQMPEMDGLEATRLIHERLGSARPHIIAATANATQDERERCLAAGMDDYLSKPIRMNELAASLGRVRPRSRPPGLIPDGVPEPRPTTAVDPSIVERLRTTLGAPSTRDLLDMFREEAPKLVAGLRSAAEQRDAVELRRTAHTLKSNAATFGATPLAELAHELETMGGEGQLEGADELVSRVEATYDEVRSALEAARRSLS